MPFAQIVRDTPPIARDKAAAEGISNVEFRVAKPVAAPWGDACCDAALTFNLLHLIGQHQVALSGIHRVLKPGGLFISKTPCLSDANPLLPAVVPAMQLVGAAPHVAFFGAAALESEIVAAGFEIVEGAFHGSAGKDARPFLVARKR